MAVFKYNYPDGDYIKVKFKCCKCGKQTVLKSSVLPTNDNSSYCKKTAECGCEYELKISDNYYETIMEIKELPKENIKSLHQIRWEDYMGYDSSFLDAIEECGVLEKCIEHASQLDNPCKDYLFGVLWCRIIGMLDFYCHYSIARQVLPDSQLRSKFAMATGHDKQSGEWSRKEIKNLIKKISFQNIDTLSNIFHHFFTFDFTDNEKEFLKEAVYRRNRWTHHQGRGSDGEFYNITKDNLTDLLEIVRSLIRKLEKYFFKCDIDYYTQIALEHNPKRIEQ